MAPRLPKIASTVLERYRVQAWLEFHAGTALRFVCAPAGSGKTTAAVLYARRRSGRVAFVELPHGISELGVITALAESVGLQEPKSYAELVESLARSAPLEIIVDSIDNANDEARALLGRIYLDVPDGVTFVYLARSEAVISTNKARVQGLLDVCDPAMLTFTPDEIARFAALLGLDADLQAVSLLRDSTNGWAIAVAGACRTAAANQIRLSDALRRWLDLNETALGELVGAALERAAPAPAFAEIDAPVDCVSIEMFGRFEMSVQGRPIAWIRRRDREIVAFLAARPRGRATRAETILAFWPDADRQLAGQSLRTACSTIRRAIGECVGRANVARYFIGGGILELVLENAVISSREFGVQYDFAVSAYDRTDYSRSLMHLRAAELLYRSPFLAGEPPTLWAPLYAEKFATMHDDVVARIQELSARMWGVGTPGASPLAAAQVSA